MSDLVDIDNVGLPPVDDILWSAAGRDAADIGRAMAEGAAAALGTTVAAVQLRQRLGVTLDEMRQRHERGKARRRKLKATRRKGVAILRRSMAADTKARTGYSIVAAGQTLLSWLIA